MAKKKYQKEAERYNAWPKKEFFLFEPKTLLIIIITSVLTLLIAFFGEKGSKFLTSVISPLPEHAPFNGTVFPVQQTPNWVKLSEAERKAGFSAIPQSKLTPAPLYNPTKLAIPAQTLKWNDPADDAVRNEKITYSTPYLGSYRLDGLENSGSHPAVDIKIPEGTPIYAMANGTVIKAEYSGGGFGNHIVLQHNNFPSPDDPNKTATFYSSYSHLSVISVKVNDVVTKGQMIGLSGSSGTATTPHLHFQIDNDNPKWHPYWPFTNADMRAAGYSFFEAINNGLGQGNAIANTINPMRYVQKYAGEEAKLVASSMPEFTQALAAVDEYDDIAFSVQIVNGLSFEENSNIKVIVQAFDSNGNLLNKPNFTDTAEISLLNGNGELNRTELNAGNFRTGIANVIRVLARKAGKDKIILRFRNREVSSQEFEIVKKTETAASFRILPEKTELALNETVAVSVRAIDADGAYIADFAMDENPGVSLTNAFGSVNVSVLSKESFPAGGARFTFTAGAEGGTTEILLAYHGQILRSPVLTIIAPPPPPVPPPAAPAAEEPPAEIPAAETPAVQPGTAPQAEPTAVAEPVTEPVAEPAAAAAEPPPQIPLPAEESAGAGTSTEILPPNANTAESADTSTQIPSQEPSHPLPFGDIPFGSEYYEALTELKTQGLVAGYSDGTFQPDREVSRAEAITFILRAINETIRENIQIPFPDVPLDIWFAKFVSTAFELGFVKGYPDGYFRPEAKVTLAEFVTMIFVAAKTDIDPQIAIQLPQGIKADDWYAPYLQEAIRQNILEVKDNAVAPNKPLTRGEIAKFLYRIKKLEKEISL